MKKGALVQLATVLVTILFCVLCVLIAIVSTKEDTTLTHDEVLNLEVPTLETLVSPPDIVVEDLVSNDFDSSSTEDLDNIPLLDEPDEEEDIVTQFVKPSSSYTSNYDGALISLEQEDINYLDEYLWGFGEDIAVYFYDIHSQVEYIYNPAQKFSLASIIKAPYCMYVYELASQGLVDLEQVISFEERHVSEGTGDIKELEFCTEFTVEELIALSIQRSDNTAIEMLRDVAPLGDFIEYIKITYELNHHEDIQWALNTITDVEDIGAYATGIYEFIEVNMYGENLKEYMVNSRNKLLYLPHTVAHKYGWTLDAFNELAIVYAENPYVLVICSKRVDGTEEDYKMFSSIGSTINNLQTNKYQALV